MVPSSGGYHVRFVSDVEERVLVGGWYDGFWASLYGAYRLRVMTRYCVMNWHGMDKFLAMWDRKEAG